MQVVEVVEPDPDDLVEPDDSDEPEEPDEPDDE